MKSSHERSLQHYPSDLTEQEWTILEPLIPPAKPGGRPRTVNMREVINAVLYLDRTGCQWRALPYDFPPWPTVWTYLRTWRNDGTWQRIHTVLREQVRVKQGREPTPSAAIIDSQSVHEASIQDHNGGKDLLTPLKGRFPRLKLIWADSGYNKGGFVSWVKATFGWEVEIVEHPWSGVRGVWVPEGGEVDWEQIRSKGSTCSNGDGLSSEHSPGSPPGVD